MEGRKRWELCFGEFFFFMCVKFVFNSAGGSFVAQNKQFNYNGVTVLVESIRLLVRKCFGVGVKCVRFGVILSCARVLVS